MIELNKNQKIILITLLAVILLVIIYYIWKITQESQEELIQISQETEIEQLQEPIETTATEIIVHIAGAVENDGIQKLPENSRVSDAIDAAGGLTSDANTKNVNLAQKIFDGQKIYIPNITEDEDEIELFEKNNSENDTIETTNIFSSKNGLVNINTATQTELETLPGIGPSTASKIINYRNTNGKFRTIEDIQNVSGVGVSKYAQIEDKITV